MFGVIFVYVDELFVLVFDGIKVGIVFLLWDYEVIGDLFLVVGELSIIFDGCGVLCVVIEIIVFVIVFFDEVDVEYVFVEGEGDCMFEYW